MFCRYCGKDIEDGSRFCGFCGSTSWMGIPTTLSRYEEYSEDRYRSGVSHPDYVSKDEIIQQINSY